MKGVCEMRKIRQQSSTLTRRKFIQIGAAGLVGSSVAMATAGTPASVPSVTKSPQDLRFGIGTDVVIMDPRMITATPVKSQVMHVLDPLLFPREDGSIEEVVLSACEPVISPPGWRVRVRPGIKFTNGEPFNAQTIKYSILSYIDDANKS